MKALFQMKNRMFEEVEAIAKKEKLTMSDLEILHKTTDTIKNIDKILMLEDQEIGHSQRGYSRDGYSREGGSYDGGMSHNSYDSGNSYGHYVRGHYSRDGGSYDGGYSRDRGRESMLQQLDSMLRGSKSEKEREYLRECMDKLGSI